MDIRWDISGLKNEALPDGSSDVILWAQWRCFILAFDADGRPYQKTITGDVPVIKPTSTTFIPYLDLTEEILLSWIWNSGVDKAQVEANLIADIQAQIAAAQAAPTQ